MRRGKFLIPSYLTCLALQLQCFLGLGQESTWLGVSVDKQDWCLNLFQSSFIQRDITSYFLAVLLETLRATGKLLVLSALPNTIAKVCTAEVA